MKTKIFLLVIIAVQFGFIIYDHYEIRKAREHYFKRGLYYGVKSLRVLIEKGEEDITWNKLYSAAIMMDFDECEENPLYDQLHKPLDAVKGRGIGATNSCPEYEQETNSVGKEGMNLCCQENRSRGM